MLSLRDKLGVASQAGHGRQKRLYEMYGVLENPFPPSHKTAGNPRQPLDADDQINERINRFLETSRSEVLVATGTQGLGKTNLLEYYQQELPPILRDLQEEKGQFYVVLYYTDPEPDFGAVVRRVFQELGIEHFKRIAQAAGKLTKPQQREVLALVRTRELRGAFSTLVSHCDNEPKLVESCKMLLEYLTGLRIYRRHEELGLQHRLDTTEAKTQALHDVIYLSHRVGVLHGLFLFLDELEKIGGLPKQSVTLYLSAIRALIDALPEHLFLMLAMTDDARERYTRALPALGGRFHDTVQLRPLKTAEEALSLYHFYLDAKRGEALKDDLTANWRQGDKSPLQEERIKSSFATLLQEGLKTGIEGVTQRRFLDRLHEMSETMFTSNS